MLSAVKIAQVKAWRRAHPERCRAAVKAWRQAHPEKARATTKKYQQSARGIATRHAYVIQYIYGITLEEKEALFVSQGSKCGCCGSSKPDNKNGWIVEHCHITDRVRGIVCHPCNITIGHLEANPDRLNAVKKYLEKQEGVPCSAVQS
jgi:Recombination endonuclease VII